MRYILFIFILLSFSAAAQESGSIGQSYILDEVIIKSGVEHSFSTFGKDGTILAPNKIRISPEYHKLDSFVYPFCYKVVNYIDSNIYANMISIKTNKSFKPEDIKLIVYIFNGTDFFAADTCSYLFAKHKAHYFQFSNKIELPDTFYVTFGLKFLNRNWKEFAFSFNPNIRGYLYRLDRRYK